MVLTLELLNISLEFLNNGLNVFQVVLFEGLKLLDGAEKVNQLANTSLEKVESTKDLGGGEVELLRLGHVFEALLGELVLGLVGLVEGLALLHHFNQLLVGNNFSLPEDGIIHTRTSTLLGLGLSSTSSLEVEDVNFTVVDHLVGDLDKEASHAFISVVVASDGVNHLNGVHQDGESLANSVWVTFVEGLNEAFKSLEVLNVVFSLVKVLSDSELNASPVAEGKVDARVSVLVRIACAYYSENGLDILAIGRADGLTDGSQHSHAQFPVVKLVARAFILVVSGPSLLFENTLNLLRPLGEDVHEVGDHLGVVLSGCLDALDVLVMLMVIALKRDVAVLGLNSLLKLASELLKNNGKVTFLFSFDDTPLFRSDLVNKGLIDVVHHGVEGDHRVIRNLTEQDLRVVGILFVNSLASRKAAEEIHSFA